MFNGKMKALTFSYDDGVKQDERLIELLNKYGMKGTFNLNSALMASDTQTLFDGTVVENTRIKPDKIRRIYEGHEVASHTLTHPFLHMIDDDSRVIREVEEDRLRLSELCGYEVVGMAYPFGSGAYNDRILNLIRNHTGIKYSRGTNSTYQFDTQTNLLEFNPTIFHLEVDKMFELGEQFLKLTPDKPQLFYIWGHSYEFDSTDGWSRFEEFLQMMSKRPDICYCTNREALLG